MPSLYIYICIEINGHKSLLYVPQTIIINQKVKTCTVSSANVMDLVSIHFTNHYKEKHKNIIQRIVKIPYQGMFNSNFCGSFVQFAVIRLIFQVANINWIEISYSLSYQSLVCLVNIYKSTQKLLHSQQRFLLQNAISWCPMMVVIQQHFLCSGLTLQVACNAPFIY